MVALSNPLSALSDDLLWNSQLYLLIICNRNKFPPQHKRTKVLCELGKALEVEADLRGLPSPKAPYHIADDQPGHHAL